MIADNPARTGDFDYSPEPVKTVKSVFDHGDDVSFSVNTDHATQTKPDAFELDLARQEKELHDAKIQLFLNRILEGKV